MNAIGFRCSTNYCIMSIVKCEEKEILLLDEIIMPKFLNKPEQLNHLRLIVSDFIELFSINYAGIKTIELKSKNKNIERVEYELILQELLTNHGIENILMGRNTSIASALGLNRYELSNIINKKQEFSHLSNWKLISDFKSKISKKNEMSEAVLVAYCSFLGGCNYE